MQLEIIQQIILGIIQGIFEWLPVSSSGIVALVNTNLFGVTNLSMLLHQALFLHLGTFFAALIYFRKDVLKLCRTLFKYKYSEESSKKILKFLIIATLISSITGLIIFETLISFENKLVLTGKIITLFIAILLLFTGIIQIKIKNRGLKTVRNLKNKDSVLLGVAQGIASLPGISRSGITVSTLLLKNFDDTTALKLSFLMSLPIVLLGNIFLNLNQLTFTTTAIYGLLTSFIFGILTIHILMRFSKKINFGWFVLIFAGLMFGSLFV